MGNIKRITEIKENLGIDVCDFSIIPVKENLSRMFRMQTKTLKRFLESDSSYLKNMRKIIKWIPKTNPEEEPVLLKEINNLKKIAEYIVKKRESKNEIKTAYCVGISGKDSIVMLLKMLEAGSEKYPITHIFFVDTGIELKENIEFFKKFDKYLQQNYGREIIFLEPKWSFERVLFDVPKSGKNKGVIKGFDAQFNKICKHWAVNKRDVINRFKKQLRAEGYNRFVFYIGYALDEQDRAEEFLTKMGEQKKTKFLTPLLDDFKLTEKECLNFIKQKPELFNPVYKTFKRTGCKFCHKQPWESWYKLYQQKFKDWQEFKNYEWKVQKAAKTKKVGNPYPFIEHQTTADVEKREFYKREEKEVLKKIKNFIKKDSEKDIDFETLKEIAHISYWLKRHKQIKDIYYTDKKAQEKAELMKKIAKDEILLSEAEEKLALEFRNEREYTFYQEFLKVLKEESKEIGEFLDSLNKSA